MPSESQKTPRAFKDSQQGALGPGQLAITSEESLIRRFLKWLLAIGTCLFVLAGFGALGWGALQILGWGISAATDSSLSTRALPPKPQFPAKYVAIATTDKHGAHRVYVFSYENLHIIRVDKISDIPVNIRHLSMEPGAGAHLFRTSDELTTIPTPLVIRGEAIEISTGPLIERNAMVAQLQNSYDGLEEASITFALAGSRGPPRIGSSSIEYINEIGKITTSPMRLIFLIGAVKNVKFPELRDNSRLDLRIFDAVDGGNQRKSVGFAFEFRVTENDMHRYYSDVYEWNSVAKAHGVESLPIDPMYASKDIRKAIGQETPEDKKEDIQQQLHQQQILEKDAHDHAVP